VKGFDRISNPLYSPATLDEEEQHAEMLNGWSRLFAVGVRNVTPRAHRLL
jgi:hypothetical protein